MIFIGIDPAFRSDGFGVAILDTQDQTVRKKKFRTFLDFLKWITAPEEIPPRAVAGIENSNLQNATFNMNGSKAKVARHSRNVGANQAASQLTVDVCRWVLGEKYVFEISPREKGRKLTHREVLAIAKQEGHTFLDYKGNKNEQDFRDAYQIALIAKKRHFFQQAKIKA